MRSLRPFLQWMGDHGIAWADGIHFHGGGEGKWGVYTGRVMEEGEIIVRIPKDACLTAYNTGAAPQIEAACLGGGLALAVAVMYERSLGPASPWHPYFAVLPSQEDPPITWPCAQVRHHLKGTELHQTVLDDIRLIRQDWQDCIAPLTEEDPATFPPPHFTLAAYLAAKTLISSRAFAIDQAQTMAMVPFADMLNHKTAAEDVHLMMPDDEGAENESATSHVTEEQTQGESGLRREIDQQRGGNDEVDSRETAEEGPGGAQGGRRDAEETDGSQVEAIGGKPPKRKMVGVGKEHVVQAGAFGDRAESDKSSKRLRLAQANGQGQATTGEVAKEDGRGRFESGRGPAERECSQESKEVTEDTASVSENVLEMELLHDIKEGAEVFNTYGRLSSGALLHRYGFTEPTNPFDLVNLDSRHVTTEAAAAPGCTPRLVRSRTALWRRALGHEATQQAWDYFEVDSRGAPESELLLLLFLIHAPDSVAAALSRHSHVTECDGDVARLAALLGYTGNERVGKGIGRGRRRAEGEREAGRRHGSGTAPRGGSGAGHCGDHTSLGAADREEDEGLVTVWCPEDDPLEAWLLTSEVAGSLLRVVDRREKEYGAGPLEQDETTLAQLDPTLQPQAYHSVALRIAERRVLDKCRRAVRRRLSRGSG